jgi:proteasome lid subunit RPN8/RPN11
MVFSMIANIIRRLRPTLRLSCPRPLWFRLLAELRERGGGRRESGAFLLGRRRPDGTRRIESYVHYDDVDPDCLRGWIEFDGSRMDEVWRRCEQAGLSVVADVHTHPGGYGQSNVDRANPMIPEAGHLALIIPGFAERTYEPGQIGLYEYLGGRDWCDHSAKGRRFFRLEGF